MVRSINIALVLMLCAAPAFAEVVYSCKLKVSPNSEAIPQKFLIEHDPESGRAIFVIDPANNKNLKKPVDGKVSTDNAKRTTFAWSLKNFKAASGRTLASVNFKATYMKASGKVSFNVSVPGTNYVEDGFGVCAKG